MKKTLVIVGSCFASVIFFALSCTKNTNPQPPIHDTVTKTQIDTIYGTKPDSTVNLTKGLLVYLPFTNSIADSSGNNNPTQAIGGNVLTYDGHGFPNCAFGSTGNGNEVIVTNNGSIKFDTAFSLSFGFMVNSLNYQVYISMVDPITGHGPTFDIGNTLPAVPNLFDIGVNDSASDCDTYGLGNPNNVTDTTAFTPVVSRWYNAIAIYHNGSVQLYINGIMISSRTGSGHKAKLCPSAQFVVGGWWNSDKLSMNGALDNIRFYNRVLTPHEIALLSSSYQVTSNSVKPAIKTN